MLLHNVLLICDSHVKYVPVDHKIDTLPLDGIKASDDFVSEVLDAIMGMLDFSDENLAGFRGVGAQLPEVRRARNGQHIRRHIGRPDGPHPVGVALFQLRDGALVLAHLG